MLELFQILMSVQQVHVVKIQFVTIQLVVLCVIARMDMKRMKVPA